MQWRQLGDLAAIPFFFLLIIYLVQRTPLTVTEQLLLLFAIIGFVFDLLSVVLKI